MGRRIVVCVWGGGGWRGVGGGGGGCWLIILAGWLLNGSFLTSWLPCHNPSKLAGSDPEAFWLQPVPAVTASDAARIGPDRIIIPDPTSRIRLSFRFSKEGMGHAVQN